MLFRPGLLDHRRHAALLVGGAATVDHPFFQFAFKGVVLPGGGITHTYRIDVGVHRDHMLAMADAAQNIAHGIDLDLVKTDPLHFAFDA